jgi:molybdopterin-guanine dinucleotide biosynthesis protein A
MNAYWTAIILTGGTSRRFGSDKSRALLASHSLLDEIFLALPPDLPVIVVGPEPINVVRTVIVTREQPAFGGPVAGIAAGLEIVETELVAIIATDMPFVVPMLLQLIKELSEEFDAAMPVDDAGFRQPLSAIYKVKSLRKAFARLGDPQGQSMRNLVALLKVREVPVLGDFENQLLDVDTPADLYRAVAFSKQMKDNSPNER